ncbi:MAG: hypothetical protein R3B48_10420 [Kofleriaceae bacterium]
MIVIDTKVTSHEVRACEVRARLSAGPELRTMWFMSLGVDPVASGTDAEWVGLGAGGALRGNRLEVRAVVMDVGAGVGELGCMLDVEGAERTLLELRSAAGSGDVAVYSLVVVFQ